MSRRVVAGVTVLAVAVLAAFAWTELATPDDVESWQATPLTPDPALSRAAASDPSCSSVSHFLNATPPPPPPLPMQVVLQDRRTPVSAGFVVTTVGYVGVCLLSPPGDGQGYLSEAPLPQMTEPLAIEGAGAGILGAPPGNASYLWGRADARIASVMIDLAPELHVFDDDDRLVTASLGGGYWFGWWPDGAIASLVTGFDAQGEAIASMKQFDEGWVAR